MKAPAARSFKEPKFSRLMLHPGRRMTPYKLLGAYDMAEAGDPYDQCGVFRDRVEADAHLRSIVEQRIEAVALKSWVLIPGGDSAHDLRASAALEERLRLVPNLPHTFTHQLWANFYGYAASEIDWQRVDGMTAPAYFDNVSVEEIRFDRADRPLLITEDNREGERLERGRWWFSSRYGDICAASGLLRTATWWSMFKSYAVRDWLTWANRFGLPYVHGKYRDDATAEDQAALKKAVQSMGKDGWAVFSDACEIATTWAEGGGGDGVHSVLTSLCDSQNSKLIVGATLVNETGGPGSFALGQVHAGRSFSITEGDAGRLAHAFQEAVAIPFLHYNGLSRARPPRLHINVVQDMSPEGRARIFAIARNEIGIALDADQVRQELQLKKPTGEALEPPAEPVNVPGGGDVGG